MARFAIDDPAAAVGFLSVVPISLLASEYGWRGGIAAAVAAALLTVMWALSSDVQIGPVGYASRIGMFFVVGIVIGLQVERRRAVERERAELIAKLRDLAAKDQLTGLPNRRAWDERLGLELARSARSGCPLSVAAIDVDGLKRVNDTQGHERGDELLKGCADALRRAIRRVDFIARLGGDEFFVLLPDCPLEHAEIVAGRMLAAAPPAHRFSVGVATWTADEPATELVRRADEALYAAKRAGGSRVCVAAGD